MTTKGWAIGTAVLAVVLLVIGLVMRDQSNFSNHYVKSQLASHGIVFTPVNQLLPAQKDKPCLVANAAKLMTTGTQAMLTGAQIGIDMLQIDHGKSYFQGHYNGYQQDQKMYTGAEDRPAGEACIHSVKRCRPRSRRTPSPTTSSPARRRRGCCYGSGSAFSASARATPPPDPRPPLPPPPSGQAALVLFLVARGTRNRRARPCARVTSPQADDRTRPHRDA